MIAKGTTHNSGGKLGRYLITGKDGERAELYELRGFASPDIVEAFRSIHVIAEATKAEAPFFHVQVRNPEGETLSREQWEYTANRIERMLGLNDQPRAIAFHVDERTGEKHMHVAWSRIDEETLTAIALPFYKERLKKISRELELHFGLTLVPNERDSTITYAPTRAEDEQGRRLGLNPHEVRQTIRDCYDRSDCGRSFEAALADQGMILAQGDRRDFLVIDQAGGMHALGKRILDVSAAEVRNRLGDIDRQRLPTVEQAQELIREQGAERRQEKPAPIWDRDRDEIAWQNAVVDAAITKERTGREPTTERQEGGRERKGQLERDREAHWPRHPPQQEPVNTSPRYWFEDAARAATDDKRPLEAPEHLKGPVAHIWTAYNRNHDPNNFAATLDGQNIQLAAVTKEEADRSYRVAAFGKEVGRFAPVYKENEIVAVTERWQVYKLNERTTGERRAEVEKFLAKLDRTSLQGIEATKQMIQDRAELRDIERQAFRDLSAVGLLKRDKEAPLGKKQTADDASAAPITRVGAKAWEAVANLAGDTIEIVGDMFGATVMTPERVAAAIDAKEKAVEHQQIDLARFRYDADYRRQVEAAETQKIEQDRQRSYYTEQQEREHQR